MNRNGTESNDLSSIIRGGLRLLNSRERRGLVWLNIVIAIEEALQMAAVLAILPVVSLVVQPELLSTSAWLVRLHAMFGSPAPDRFIKLLSVAALLLIGIAHVGSFLVQFAIESFTARAQTRLARDLMAQCIEAPYKWFLSRNSAVIVRVIHNDVHLWGRDFIGSFLHLLTHALTIIAGAGLVLASAPIGGFATLVALGLLAYAVLSILRPYLVKCSAFKKGVGEQTAIIENQMITGVKEVKVSGNQGVFVQLFASWYGLLSRTSVRMVMLGQVSPGIMMFLGQASLLFITVALWLSGSRGGALASQLALIVLVTSRVVPSINRLMVSVNAIANSTPLVSGILAMLSTIADAHRKEYSAGTTASLKPDWKRIRFVEVGFSYEGGASPVLKDLSFEMERGKSYGLIGASGAGKSTVVDILLGLLQPTAGRICVDAVSLGCISRREWQHRIGYVQQTPYFLDDTIRANIAFGTPPESIDEELVRHCVSKAGLEDFVASLPKGLATGLGDRALKISGGQRQRIAIARALYKQPDILVLDEATSSLDAANKQLVIRSIEGLKGETTTLLVSHDVETVAFCDSIFLLEGGRIGASGRLEEVVLTHPVFGSTLSPRS